MILNVQIAYFYKTFTSYKAVRHHVSFVNIGTIIDWPFLTLHIHPIFHLLIFYRKDLGFY